MIDPTPSPADARAEALKPSPWMVECAKFLLDTRDSLNLSVPGVADAIAAYAPQPPAARADAEATGVAMRLKMLAGEASIDQRFSMSDKLHAIAAQVRALGRGEAGLRGLVEEWVEATANYKHAATHADDYGEEEMADLRARCRNAEAALAAEAKQDGR